MSKEKVVKEKNIKKEDNKLPLQLPILPLRNSVFFPSAVMPLTVGRNKTITLIEEVSKEKSLLGIITQKGAEIENPSSKDLYEVGTIAKIIKLARSGKKGFNVVVEGLYRFQIKDFIQEDPFFIAKIRPLFDQIVSNIKTNALAINLKNTAREVIELLPEIPVMAKQLLDSITVPGHLADLITANIDATVEEKQDILEHINLTIRLDKVLELLNRQFEVLKLSNKINIQVKGEMSKTQREYYLRQQLKVIKEELGEKDDDENDIDDIERKLKKVRMSNEAKKVAARELRRMKNIQPSQAEYTVSRTYLEWLADLPWGKYTVDNLDLKNAKKQLDEDHYGLEKVKKRIIEYLAVRSLRKNMRGPILCFVGPPGVGKTSLGRSIADALNRKFHRMSLGGVRDEAEIRGHRRTYIGALPGRILQGIKKAGSQNPVFLLDEIDKLGNDFRGDPSSALLEVLDPEQNNSFSDHYLDVDFDLSRVLFIATANQVETIPIALNDRMEKIELLGYTFEEKESIAQKHLVPNQILEHGLKKNSIIFPKETVLKIAISYTREAGVRNLEREIASICRTIAFDIVKNKKKVFAKKIITLKKYEKILGPEKFYNETVEMTSTPGVATGLAWTAAGGDILFIEASKMGGKGAIVLTGQLGGVMKESAQAALSWTKSNARLLKLTTRDDFYFLEKMDIHLHFPAGAIPKDGPSAGVTIITALVSLLTKKLIRFDTAMTGEITLRGNVLPVGGIKEKVLAAHRAGIKRVVMPLKNKKDLIDVPKNIRKEITFLFASNVKDVLSQVFIESVNKKKHKFLR